jgi:hypothetical protein
MHLRLGLGEYGREAAWLRFIQAGFTEDDLLTVIRHLRHKIKAGARYAPCLRFSRLIECLDSFEEELALAKAEMRNAKRAPTAKERVIQQARPVVAEVRPEDHRVTARPVSDLIADLRRAAGVRV